MVLVGGLGPPREGGFKPYKEDEDRGVFQKDLPWEGIRPLWHLSSLLLDLTVRWFVYVCSLLAAIDILGFKALEPFVTAAVQYLPHLIGGILILVIGLVAVDFVADLSRATGLEARVEYAGVVILGFRLILYFAVAIVALSIMKVDVSILYIFANALAWGVAVGVGAGLGIALGWGFKGFVARNAERWISGARGAVERVGEAAEL